MSIKLPIVNSPIGVDFDKTESANKYIAVKCLCEIIKNLNAIDMSYYMICDNLLKYTSKDTLIADCIHDNLDQSAKDVFAELVSRLPDSPPPVMSPIEYISKRDKGERINPKLMKEFKGYYNGELIELLVTIEQVVSLMRISTDDKNLLKSKVHSIDKNLHGYFNVQLIESRVNEKDNNPIATKIFAIINALLS